MTFADALTVLSASCRKALADLERDLIEQGCTPSEVEFCLARYRELLAADALKQFEDLHAWAQRGGERLH